MVVRVGSLLRRLTRDRFGVTALEYGVIAGVFTVGLVTAFVNLRGKVTTAISAIAF